MVELDLNRVETLAGPSQRAMRLARVGSVVVAAIAYPVLIAAKVCGLLPQHFSWPKVAIGPLAVLGLLFLPFWLGGLCEQANTRQKNAK